MNSTISLYFTYHKPNSMALYLTYRPQTFDTLIGQDHIANILKPKVLNNDYAHSNFLFYGPRGTGKTSTARIFAKAINCLNPHDGNPCNKCENCLAINANKTIDVVEIDAASHTQVDNIREEIIDKAPYPPSHLKKKVYIIDEVHMLSKSAFNALLKIMEEPPAYLVFILATTEIHKVPETIISRCQIFTFKKIPVLDLVNHLQNICTKEGFTYQDGALTSIAKISDGCARDAIKYLDQVSILGDITQDHVSSFLGVASDQLIEWFLAACIAKDIDAAFAIVDTLSESGIDISNFVKQSLIYIEEHFQENPAGYIACAEIFKRISYGLRNFPLPTVLMKMEIYNGFTTWWETINITPTAPKTSPSTPKAPKEPMPAAYTPSSDASSTINTPDSSESDKKKLNLDNDSLNNEENIMQTRISWQIETMKEPVLSSHSTPEVSPTSKTSIEPEKQPPVATQENITDNNTPINTDLISGWLQIAELVERTPDLKQSLKSMLIASCILEEQVDQTVLYVFNKLQGGLLQKPENRNPIEQAYKAITGKDRGMQIIIMSKEEYFAQKL